MSRRNGLAALATIATVSLVFTVVSLHGGRSELLEVWSPGYTNMLSSAQQESQSSLGPIVDYYYPQLQAVQSPAVQQQLSSAQEMARPVETPSYNSGEGMTYMPSTQSGVSADDQSPSIPAAFLDDEEKAKKRMKKLAKLLKKSAKEQEALDVKACFITAGTW